MAVTEETLAATVATLQSQFGSELTELKAEEEKLKTEMDEACAP